MRFNNNYSKDTIDSTSIYSHAHLTGKVLGVQKKKHFIYIIFYKFINSYTHGSYINRPCVGGSILYCDCMGKKNIFKKNIPYSIIMSEVI
jgi:hypothetical protein